MRQVLTIFRKDVKHLWPLAAFMLAIVSFHGWLDIQMSHGYLRVRNDRILSKEPMLLLIAWWCLAGMVVQQEPVPDDRQYWLSRPIPRKALIGTKALYMVICVCLPNVLAQAVVLGSTGFSPADFLGALVWNQVMISTYFVMAASVAAVTRNFRQCILTSVVAFAAVVFYSERFNGFDDGSGGVQWARDTSVQLEMVAAGIVALALQYTWRRTGLARVLVGAGVVVGLLLCSLNGRHVAFAVTSALAPRQESSSRVRIVFDAVASPADNPVASEGPRAFGGTPIRVAIPVLIAGIPPGRELISEHVSARLEAPGTVPWNSGW
jgi:hypothetical protein